MVVFCIDNAPSTLAIAAAYVKQDVRSDPRNRWTAAPVVVPTTLELT
jgi:hypothetical protein